MSVGTYRLTVHDVLEIEDIAFSCAFPQTSVSVHGLLSELAVVVFIFFVVAIVSEPCNPILIVAIAYAMIVTRMPVRVVLNLFVGRPSKIADASLARSRHFGTGKWYGARPSRKQ
jgi:hypothetical protein